MELQCSVRSIFIPTFMWNFTRNGSSEIETIVNGNGPFSTDYSIIPDGGRSQILIINNAHWRHNGYYKCVVSTDNNQIQAEAFLTVLSEYSNNVDNIV